MATTITIGRAPTNSIVVGDAFQTVSNNHAELTFQDDGRLRYTDHSSNGTVINGLPVNNKSVFVTTDDVVRLADSFPIDWQVVYRLIPELARADSKRTRRIQPSAQPRTPEPEPAQPAQPAPAADENPRMTRRHNYAETAPIEQNPPEEPAEISRGTERFDRQNTNGFKSADPAGTIGTGATVAVDMGQTAGQTCAPQQENKGQKHKSHKNGHAKPTPWPTIILCFVAFLAVMAILAFTVFDDVVKNIM